MLETYSNATITDCSFIMNKATDEVVQSIAEEDHKFSSESHILRLTMLGIVEDPFWFNTVWS